MERRRFLTGSGTVLTTVLAGCTGDEEPTTEDSRERDAGGDGFGGSESTQIPQSVEPTVTDLRHPEPQGVSTDDESLENNQHSFSVTVENTGMAGDVEMTLVLLEDRNTSIWSTQADEAGSYQRYFSEGERRSETFTAELDGRYEGFGFRLIPAEAEVDVRNDGASGEVEVQLVQRGGLGDGVILERKNTELSEGTTTVPFTIDASFAFEQDIDGIELDAEALPV